MEGLGILIFLAALLLFALVIIGMYGGFVTVTEAAGVGAVGALLIGVARGKLPGMGADDIETATITARPVCQSPVSSNTISVVEIGAPSTAAATAPIPASA